MTAEVLVEQQGKGGFVAARGQRRRSPAGLRDGALVLQAEARKRGSRPAWRPAQPAGEPRQQAAGGEDQSVAALGGDEQRSCVVALRQVRSWAWIGLAAESQSRVVLTVAAWRLAGRHRAAARRPRQAGDADAPEQFRRGRETSEPSASAASGRAPSCASAPVSVIALPTGDVPASGRPVAWGAQARRASSRVRPAPG